MGYQDGVAAAESKLIRFDWFGQKKAKCDPRYGWKAGPKGKCVRVPAEDDPEKGYGTDVFLTEHDKDLIEIQFDGSEGINEYQAIGNKSRKNAVLYARDQIRLTSQQEDGVDYNKEIGRLNRFTEAREKGDKTVKNQYGTNQFISSSEARWIDDMGGPSSVPGLQKNKAVDYLKDAYMTMPKFSTNPQKDLDLVNKHYFGK